jgi:hypothetical protein
MLTDWIPTFDYPAGEEWLLVDVYAPDGVERVVRRVADRGGPQNKRYAKALREHLKYCWDGSSELGVGPVVVNVPPVPSNALPLTPVSVNALREVPDYDDPTLETVVRNAREAAPKAEAEADTTRRREITMVEPAWFRIYARLEAEAVEIHEYATMVIPGLLQTEAYARALYQARQPRLDEATIEKRVADRLSRQEILMKWPPPDTTFVIEESVLHRPIGGWEVMRGQLQNLLRASELRGVELQIMPTERAEHPGLPGPFTVLTPKGKPQLGYVESNGQPRLITDADQVRAMANRYGNIRAQALNFRESQALIEKLLGGEL